MKYIQEKYIKSSFSINIRSGELQATCIEFIKKCNDLMQEKLKDRIGINNNMPLLLTSPHKIIAMVKHKGTNEVTVVCNNDVISPNDFISQLTSHVLLHVSQHALMLSDQVDMIIGSFHSDFKGYKSLNNDLNLVWYKVTEEDITRWLASRPISPDASLPLPLPLLPSFSTDEYITGDFVLSPGDPSKKRRTDA